MTTTIESTTPASPKRRRLMAMAAALPAAFAAPRAFAQGDTAGFPARPVKFIVPFPPGSGTDTSARIFAKKIGDITGQPVTVENKPGGNGFIGVQTALNAPADGYTVFIGSNSTLSTNAATFRKLPYDPLTDFAPISLLTRGPCLIIVPPNSPYRSVDDLVADAKKRPGALNYASGSMSYTLYSEWLNDMTGMRTTGINYKGAGDAINVTLSGTVDFAVVDASGAIELVRSGKLRALAFTAPQRTPLLPDVPNATEAGIPQFLAYNWVAAAVSARTPPEVVKRWSALFHQAAETQELKDYYKRQSTTVIMSSPAEMRQYQQEEIQRWKQLASRAGIALQ
ncbi:tripartite tricarboxylate transporter substrate binding protein [Cupriavidus respiraculi]|uniref:Extra-cytoplasmic solute receptor n=1 Tax=Cupriavidus respiraculi TaxID=195930 RepID=A0ABN7Y6M5_9BURK|nr:tripartite tricarboxylate transporter substrate binding protein [Cupriavidus respiraculi]CAG9168833.1 hypothetical protein LMG21510_01260 [Cupriavidus respiraculi]